MSRHSSASKHCMIIVLWTAALTSIRPAISYSHSPDYVASKPFNNRRNNKPMRRGSPRNHTTARILVRRDDSYSYDVDIPEIDDVLAISRKQQNLRKGRALNSSKSGERRKEAKEDTPKKDKEEDEKNDGGKHNGGKQNGKKPGKNKFDYFTPAPTPFPSVSLYEMTTSTHTTATSSTTAEPESTNYYGATSSTVAVTFWENPSSTIASETTDAMISTELWYETTSTPDSADAMSTMELWDETTTTSVGASSPPQSAISNPAESTSYTETSKPTSEPTVKPTSEPTAKPTRKPTAKPTREPTDKPTSKPTEKPTSKPPTNIPTSSPTQSPSEKPTRKPTEMPSNGPTNVSCVVNIKPCNLRRKFSTEMTRLTILSFMYNCRNSHPLSNPHFRHPTRQLFFNTAPRLTTRTLKAMLRVIESRSKIIYTNAYQHPTKSTAAFLILMQVCWMKTKMLAICGITAGPAYRRATGEFLR